MLSKLEVYYTIFWIMSNLLLNNLADARYAGRFLGTLSLVFFFVKQHLRKIYFRISANHFIIFFFAYFFVRRQFVNMLESWQKRQSADNLPIFIKPVSGRKPLVIADGNRNRLVVLGIIYFYFFPIFQLL